MEIYLVGGAVRDKIMNKEPHDKDFVVVGSTIQEMLDNGFKQVGNDFPVFLHPESGNEYALARTEKKVGNKHTDFVCGFEKRTTLLEDLYRRDFTCNAIAYNIKNETCWSTCLNDPFKGRMDIMNKVLRAVNPETFIEDPLRVVRAARFAAQLGFNVESNTMELLKKMVNDGMLEHLTAERVWKETEKALSKGYDSSRFFEVLKECGALKVLFPEVYALTNAPEQLKYHNSGNSFTHTMIALNRVQEENSLIKFAVCVHDLGKGNTPKDILPKHNGHDERGIHLIDEMCDRLKIPNKYRDFGKLFCKEHMRIAKFNDMKLSKQYDLIYEISDKFKNKEKFESFLKCFYADFFGEEVLSEYSDPKYYDLICEKMKNVFSIMFNITLKNLSEKDLQLLSRFKGEKYGIIYREVMIDYLRHHIK